MSSIPQCKQKRHECASQELFHPNGRVKSSFIDTHQALNMICTGRWVKLQIKTHLCFHDIITSSNQMFIDWESDMAVECQRVCHSAQETIEGDIIIEYNAGAEELTIELLARQQYDR